MRKFVLLVAALFMTVPAMAVPKVDITCSADDNEVTVSYAVTSSSHLIRAVALDITVDSGAKIIKVVVPADPCYRIFPGQIVITGGDVTNYSTPYDPCDIGDANVTIEMGSLYTTDANYEDDPNAGYNKKPNSSGTLLKFYVDADCNYTIEGNPIRGKVVMEDPTEDANVTYCSGYAPGPSTLDFGDAPESYVTSLPNGPRHTITTGGPILGNLIDPEGDGQPSVGATGDDVAVSDDEDGVKFVQLIVNEPANSSVTVTVSQAGGILNGWIDWGNDGSFAQAIDYVVQNVNVGISPPPIVLQIAVPAAGVVKNTTLYSRWRISTLGSPTYYGGPADDGEVEDHYDPNSAVVCHIPNVVGMTQADANAAIIAAGFQVGTITVSASSAVPDFRIISSDPCYCNYPPCTSSVNMVRNECYAGQGNYASWVTVGKPTCWCYPRQCHGDADGKRHGTSTVGGYWWVGQPDLDIMSLGWLKKEPPKGSGVIGRTTGGGIPLICADFGHDKHGTSTVGGYWWVGQPDLDKMSLYWLKKEPPKGSGTLADCPPGNRNP
jgi:hypothetical protein